MKKLVALLLVVCMVLSLGTVALAEEKDMTGKTVILHSNDVHGAIAGYAKMAALKAKYEAAGAEVILVDAGDYSQGTTYVSVSKGADAVDMMNTVGYDVVTIGNHEFDYGYAQLAENMKKATFKVVCADVFDADGKTIFDANTVYTTKSGVKVGFFGLETPEAQTKANPALIQGLKFLAGEEMFKCAQDQIDALKKDADVVIGLTHLGVDDESIGNRSYDLYEKISGADFIIDAHSHTVMTEGANKEKIQSTGTAFENIGVIVIDDASKKIEENYLVELTDDSPADETVAAAAQKIIDRVNAEYDVKFATSEVTLNGAKAPLGNRDSETNNGDLITDSMLWAILKNKSSLTVDADHVVAITNGGGIRAAIKPGDVTKKDVNTVLPFGNTVAVVYVDGAALLEALEASTYCTPEAVGGFPQIAGMKITIDITKDYDANEETYPASTYYGPKSINRVTIDSVNGKAFDKEATYAVITNNFCAEGGDTYYAFASATNKFDTGLPLDEVLMDYITTELKGVIGTKYAAPQGRITVKGRFDDVPYGNWAYEYVEDLAAAGIMKGTSATTFGGSSYLNRAMVVTTLYRIAGEPAVEKKVSEIFSDCTDDTWYSNAVVWASENGIVKGYEGGVFKPMNNITRQELAKVLYGYAQSLEKGFTGAWVFQLDNPDAASVAEWASEAMHWVVMKQILGGKGAAKLLDPQGLATRAEAAKMLSILRTVLAEEEA